MPMQETNEKTIAGGLEFAPPLLYNKGFALLRKCYETF